MDRESLVIGIPCSGRLKPTDIGTVSKLCLSVTADDLIISSRLQELLLLFRCTLLAKRDLICQSILTYDGRYTYLEH